MSRNPCNVCLKQVSVRHHAIQCNICQNMTHKKCNKLTDIDFQKLKTSTQPWYCIVCISEIFPFNSLTDKQLALILLTGTNISFEFDNIFSDISLFPPSNKSRTFKSFNDFISSNRGLDDNNFSSNINCKYFDIDEFCAANFNQNTPFSLLHMNISSLSAHLDELDTMLTLLNQEFSIIGISETRIKKDFQLPTNINIEGYSIEQTPTEASCGGTLLYINNNLNYKLRDDLIMYNSKSLESIFIEVIYQNKPNAIIGCIYKHPCMKIDEFTSFFLTPLLNTLSAENKNIFLMGDFNVNLLQCNKDDNISEFFNLLTSNNLLPHITIPTRITNSSSTLIDNIFTNSTSSNLTSGNLTSSISDHLPQFLIFPDMNKKFIPKRHNIYRRNLEKINKTLFLNEFLSINWDNAIDLQNCDTNLSFESFFSKFNELLDKHAPLIKVSNKKIKNQFKPWITHGIRTSIRKRNKLKNKFLRAKDPTNKNNLQMKFKVYRNAIVELIRQSKENHFKIFFQTNNRNLRETWKGIKSLINICDPRNNSPTCISHNNATITDPVIISNTFNDFFTSIASKLQSSIHYSHTDFKKYLKTPNLHSIFISPTESTEISLLISNLNNKKASGPNSIPTSILQLLNKDISIILSKLFNLSFSSGIFPNILKLSSVIPIHKKGSKTLCNNYRPISLISNISKLIEKLMYSRLYSFLNIYNCLNNLQFGFRSNHSTSHALISITEKIQEALDSGHFSCGVFIDLQKAFDTVDHEILLNKLTHYGIRGVANQWFKTYITERYQLVSINGFKSTPKLIRFGVPQGSVLGPLLFLIYINDLHNSITHSTVHHFADDTNLLYSSKSLKKIGSKINYDLKGLTDWLNANRISLNVGKTEYIVFHHNKKVIDYDLKIKLNGKRLFPSTSVRYLGVLFDRNLSWTYHIANLSKKLSRANSMLSKIRHFVDHTTLRSIYFAIFSSHLTYGSLVWGQKGNPNLKKVISLQNIALRILTFSPFRSSTSELYPEMRILKFADHINVINCLLAHDHVNNMLPISISNILTKTSDIHPYGTRNIDSKLNVPSIKTLKYGKYSKKLCGGEGDKHQCVLLQLEFDPNPLPRIP